MLRPIAAFASLMLIFNKVQRESFSLCKRILLRVTQPFLIIESEVTRDEVMAGTKFTMMRSGSLICYSRIPAERRGLNRRMLSPTLFEALSESENGSGQNQATKARARYERSRLIWIDQAPTWVTELIHSKVKSAFKSFRPNDYRPPGFTAPMRLQPYSENEFDQLGLRAHLSYRGGMEFLALARSLHFEGPLLTPTAALLPNRFSPVDPGPFGNLARASCLEALQTLLCGTIIEDCVAASGLDVDDSIKVEMLVTYQKEPWSLISSGLWDRLLLTHKYLDELQSEGTTVPLPKRTSLFRDALHRVPPRVAERFRDRDAAPARTAAKRHRFETVHHGKAEEVYRQTFIAEMLEILKRSHPHVQAPRKLASKLFSLSRRGGGSFDSLRHEIGDESDPYKVVERAYLRIHESSAKRLALQSGSTSVAERVSGSDPAAPATESDAIKLMCHSDFREWLGAIRDEIVRHRILARLERAEAGNLGRWKSVKGAPMNVRALALNFRPGYRIYFRDDTPQQITLLVGGTVSTHASDAQRANELSVTCNTPEELNLPEWI